LSQFSLFSFFRVILLWKIENHMNPHDCFYLTLRQKIQRLLKIFHLTISGYSFNIQTQLFALDKTPIFLQICRVLTQSTHFAPWCMCSVSFLDWQWHLSKSSLEWLLRSGWSHLEICLAACFLIRLIILPGE
jgi:hypothetical protein